MATRHTLKRASFIALATLVVLVLIEGVLRIAVFRCTMPEPNLCAFGTVSYRVNETLGGGDLVPSRDGIWALWPHRPYHVQTNSEGLRNKKEVDPDVDLRILAVGDSFTFGPYVPNEDTWPGWLEHVLNARLHPRERVQVLNGGVAGYTVRDEYYYLAEWGLGLEPDVVVVALFPNDISDFESLQREYLARPETTVRARSVVSEARAVFARLESRLAILQLATRAKRTMQAEDVRARQGESSSRAGARRVCDPYSKPDASDPCWQGFALWLRRTISLLRDSGTSFLIVAIPDQSQLDGGSSPTTPQEFIGQICSGERAPFLNLLPFLAELEDSESVYLQRRDPATGEYVGNAHMSSYGYRQIARLIADELEKLGVVPPR